MGILTDLENAYTGFKTELESIITPANLNGAEVVVEDVISFIEKLGGDIATVESAVTAGASPLAAAVAGIVSLVTQTATTLNTTTANTPTPPATAAQ